MIDGMIILIFFCYRAGMSVSMAIGFIIFYFALSSTITRLRAEVGFPNHDVHLDGPVQMIASAVRTDNL